MATAGSTIRAAREFEEGVAMGTGAGIITITTGASGRPGGAYFRGLGGG